MKQARDAGVPVGAYHFARPDPGDAQSEARFFLANTDIRAGDMLPMLDLESLEGMSLAEVTRWTGRWVDTVTRDLRRRGLVGKPIIYTPFDLGNGFGCLLWVARYSDDFRAPKIPKPWQRATIWQHSNGRYGPVKRVPGFGPVDVNAVHPDVPLSALRVKRVRRPADAPGPVPGTTPTSRPAPAPSPKPSPPEPVGVPALPEPALPEPRACAGASGARGRARAPGPRGGAGAPRLPSPCRSSPTRWPCRPCRPCRRCPPCRSPRSPRRQTCSS